jgi:hypothetical protein
MDEQTVRAHAQALCDALATGEIGEAAKEMSRELQANLGQLVAMLPLPLSEAEVENVEMTRNGYRAVLRLTGASGSLLLETRWKEREGRATMVEASHLAEAPTGPEGGAEAAGSAESAESAES